MRWTRRAFLSDGLFRFAWFYAVVLAVLWLIIAIADLIGRQPQLAGLHALVLFLVWIGLTSYDFYSKYRGIAKTAVGWEFDATVDDDRVQTNARAETHEVPWSFYTRYREYEDHLEIHDKKEQVTFLPKTDELEDLIAFTKRKIKRR